MSFVEPQYLPSIAAPGGQKSTFLSPFSDEIGPVLSGGLVLRPGLRLGRLDLWLEACCVPANAHSGLGFRSVFKGTSLSQGCFRCQRKDA